MSLSLPKIIMPVPISVPKPPSAGPPPADGLMVPNQPGNGDDHIVGSTQRFRVGYADTRGWRDKMEDAIVLVGSFRNNPEEDYFGLFDGHSGDFASKYCAKLLHSFLEKRMNELNDPSRSLVQAFIDCHESMKSTSTDSGTTSLVAYFIGDQLYIANSGDSRAVISQQKTAQIITTDHKPNSESEKRRIEAIPGGYIYKNRVQGKLAVARSIGDFSLNPYVTPEPEIFGPYFWKDQILNSGILILACDGLWDVTSAEEAMHVARNSKNPQEAALRLRDDAYEKRSRDNISVIVIWFPEFIPPEIPEPVKIPSVEEDGGGENEGEEEEDDDEEDDDEEDDEEEDDSVEESGSGSRSEDEESGSGIDSEDLQPEKKPVPCPEKIGIPSEKNGIGNPTEKNGTKVHLETSKFRKNPESEFLKIASPQNKKPTEPQTRTPTEPQTRTPTEPQNRIPAGHQSRPPTEPQNRPPTEQNGTLLLSGTPQLKKKTVPKRPYSYSLPAGTPFRNSVPPNTENLPIWKRLQFEREQKEKERKEAEKLTKLQTIRGIAHRASASGNPSVSAQAIAAVSPRLNSQ